MASAEQVYSEEDILFSRKISHGPEVSSRSEMDKIPVNFDSASGKRPSDDIPSTANVCLKSNEYQFPNTSETCKSSDNCDIMSDERRSNSVKYHPVDKDLNTKKDQAQEMIPNSNKDLDQKDQNFQSGLSSSGQTDTELDSQAKESQNGGQNELVKCEPASESQVEDANTNVHQEFSKYFSHGYPWPQQLTDICTKVANDHENKFLQDEAAVSEYFSKNFPWPLNMNFYAKRFKPSLVGKSFVECKVCGQPFRDAHGLKRHSVVHTGGKLYQCGVCEKSFSRSDKLTRHKLIHTGERPWKCPLCPKSFSRPDKLRRHNLVHTGEKPWNCGICGKGFAQPDKLRLHTLVHTGEKPWKCEVCGKAFNRSDRLKTHFEIHTRDGPRSWKCGVCNKAFTRVSSLKRHMALHKSEGKSGSSDITSVSSIHNVQNGNTDTNEYLKSETNCMGPCFPETQAMKMEAFRTQALKNKTSKTQEMKRKTITSLVDKIYTSVTETQVDGNTLPTDDQKSSFAGVKDRSDTDSVLAHRGNSNMGYASVPRMSDDSYQSRFQHSQGERPPGTISDMPKPTPCQEMGTKACVDDQKRSDTGFNPGNQAMLDWEVAPFMPLNILAMSRRHQT